MFFDFTFMLSFCLSAFFALVVYMIYSGRSDAGFSGLSSITVGLFTFIVVFMLLFNAPFLSREHMKKSAIAEEKQEQQVSRIEELKEKSQIWVDSYDDKKFSTYELYLLKNVQKETKVKVYDKGISLQDKGTKSDSKDFTDLLLKAKTELDKK